MSAGIISSQLQISGGVQATPVQPEERRVRRLQRFHQPWQRAIAGLTACTPELEDLADSFPALLFALVSGYCDADARASACARIAAGACLKDAAESLGLPLWLRRLPPESFAATLPQFPTDAEFALRIGNHVPRDPGAARQWLVDLGMALAAAGPAYALWYARHIKPGVLAEDAALMMGAWAWFSQTPGHLGHTLLRRPWTADISPRRAMDEFSYWRRRLRLVDAVGLGLEDCWLAPGTASGLTFVPLRTVCDFLEESQKLENCLDQFADHLLTGNSFVFSIRRGERRVACVEIGLHPTDFAMPAIVQLRGARNRRAPPAIWQATFAWLGNQKLTPRKPRACRTAASRRGDARIALWQPYLAHLAATPYEDSLRRWLVLPVRARKAPRSRAAAKVDRPSTLTSPPAAAGVKAAETTRKG